MNRPQLTTKKTNFLYAKRHPLNAGFTLVETLVAIFVLMVAIVSPMSIASQALSSARYSKEQVTSFYLAQEGIELVRNIRDNNVLSNNTWNEGGGLGSSVSGSETICYSANGCMIEPSDLSVSVCGSSCDLLYTNTTTGVYTYNSSGAVQTPFRRTIKITKLSGAVPPEIRVSSTVSWSSNSFSPDNTFTITDNLLNWQ